MCVCVCVCVCVRVCVCALICDPVCVCVCVSCRPDQVQRLGVGRRPLPQGSPGCGGAGGRGGQLGAGGDGGHVAALARPGLPAEVGRRCAGTHRQAARPPRDPARPGAQT